MGSPVLGMVQRCKCILFRYNLEGNNSKRRDIINLRWAHKILRSLFQEQKHPGEGKQHMVYQRIRRTRWSRYKLGQLLGFLWQPATSVPRGTATNWSKRKEEGDPQQVEGRDCHTCDWGNVKMVFVWQGVPWSWQWGSLGGGGVCKTS